MKHICMDCQLLKSDCSYQQEYVGGVGYVTFWLCPGCHVLRMVASTQAVAILKDVPQTESLPKRYSREV